MKEEKKVIHDDDADSNSFNEFVQNDDGDFDDHDSEFD